jgi:hypothetical protein
MLRVASAEAKKIEIESVAADQFFKGNAVIKEQIKVAGEAFNHATKFVVGTDILGAVEKVFKK